jgi:hypothetical protein
MQLLTRLGPYGPHASDPSAMSAVPPSAAVDGLPGTRARILKGVNVRSNVPALKHSSERTAPATTPFCPEAFVFVRRVAHLFPTEEGVGADVDAKVTNFQRSKLGCGRRIANSSCEEEAYRPSSVHEGGACVRSQARHSQDQDAGAEGTEGRGTLTMGQLRA